ncbi:MAG: DUF3084 domain-containing protein [Candidatus Riflebacteria bacterium]|nr:DUF3084 domain-containing protein [Candidatus Riflebacteria bacterium]
MKYVWLVLLLLVALVLVASRFLGVWAFLVLLGGVLSYLGDYLGSFYGKKRISLWGIRPKNTAVIISVVTGTLITLGTLAGAVLISEDYREALLQVREKKAERERLNRENASLALKEKQLSGKLADTEVRLDHAEAELKAADKTRQELAREIEELKRQREEKVAQLKTLALAFSKKETSMIAVTTGSPLLRRPLLLPIDVSREALKKELTTMLQGIRETVESAGVKVPEPDADKVEKDLVAPIRAKIQTIASAYSGDGEESRERPLPTHVYIRPTSLKNLSYGEQLSSVHFDVKPNRVIFRKGEEIAHTPIDGRLSPEKILQQLFNFDQRVQEEMQKKEILDEALQRRLGKVTPELLLQFVRIVELVKRLDRWVTVRLVASGNILAYGEINATYEVREMTKSEAAAAKNLSSPASPRTSEERIGP